MKRYTVTIYGKQPVCASIDIEIDGTKEDAMSAARDILTNEGVAFFDWDATDVVEIDDSLIEAEECESDLEDTEGA